MAAPLPVVQVLAAFGGVTYTDISAYVLQVNTDRPVTRLQGPLWQYQAGTASIVLDNSDGRFDPDNLAGPYTSSTGLQQVIWTVAPAQTKTWTAPRNLSGTTIKVECWGPGSTGTGGAGGGGGEYAAETAYAVIPGNQYVAVTASGNSGSSTTFDGSGVVAHAATPNSATPGSGSTNSIHFSGGTGGASGSGHNPALGGGGGSSGGNAATGNNGTAGNSGGQGGVAPAGGFAGGAGAPDGRYAGRAGAGPGGGGGGSGETSSGNRISSSAQGHGLGGQVRLTYFVTVTSAATLTQVLPMVPVQVNATWPVPALVTRTSPPAFGNISIVSVAGGTWTVSWSVTLSGTVGAGDANNFQLTNGGTFVAQSVNAGAAGTYQQATQVLTFTGGAPFVQVIAGAGTPTTGAVYGATISVTYSLLTGFADSWTETPVTYSAGYSEVTLAATDGFKLLSGNQIPVTSPLGSGDDSGQRVSRILDIAGWPASNRLIDPGDTVQQPATFGSDALTALQQAADTEIGELYVNGAGLVVFRHRQAILNDTRSVFPQAVFGDQPGAQDAQVSWHGDGTHGGILISANPPGSFFPAATPASKQIWCWSSAAYASGVQLVLTYYDSTLTIISTSTGTITATGPVPVLLSVSGTSPAGTVFINVQPQVQGTPASTVSFFAAAAPPLDANDLNLSPAAAPWIAGFFTTISTLGTWEQVASVPGELAYEAVGRANDDTTLANDIQITTTAYSGDTSPVLQEATDPVSVYVYQSERSYARTDLLLPDDATALLFANWVLYISKNSEDRFDTLTIDPLADTTGLYPQVLGREIGDRVQIWRTPAGVASRVTKDVFIRGISHAHDPGQQTWQTTWTLQSAARYSGFMTLDSAISGLLDTDALAY